MSSGRDEWMSRWSQETRESVYKVKTPLERMVEYRKTLLAEVERLDRIIEEMQSEA